VGRVPHELPLLHRWPLPLLSVILAFTGSGLRPLLWPSTTFGQRVYTTFLRCEDRNGFRSKKIIKRSSYPCNRPWRTIGLWDIEAPTLFRQSVHRCRWGCQPYTPASRPLPPGRFLVLIYSLFIQLEGLGKLKNPVTSSGTESHTFRLVVQCLNQLCYHVPLQVTKIPTQIHFDSYGILVPKHFDSYGILVPRLSPAELSDYQNFPDDLLRSSLTLVLRDS
jgi:hypothetical protein